MIQAFTASVRCPDHRHRAKPGLARCRSSTSKLAVDHVVRRAFTLDPGHRLPRWFGDHPRARMRQISMYLQHVACGVTLADVGSAHGRDRTTAAHACHVVEDLRDYPEFDFTLEVLEAALAALMRR
jgi:hypothetical protein